MNNAKNPELISYAIGTLVQIKTPSVPGQKVARTGELTRQGLQLLNPYTLELMATVRLASEIAPVQKGLGKFQNLENRPAFGPYVIGSNVFFRPEAAKLKGLSGNDVYTVKRRSRDNKSLKLVRIGEDDTETVNVKKAIRLRMATPQEVKYAQETQPQRIADEKAQKAKELDPISGLKKDIKTLASLVNKRTAADFKHASARVKAGKKLTPNQSDTVEYVQSIKAQFTNIAQRISVFEAEEKARLKAKRKATLDAETEAKIRMSPEVQQEQQTPGFIKT